MTKTEMVYKDYTWTASLSGDNPFIIGGKERQELNRKEGYEVLYFINKLGTDTWKHLFDKATGQQIERMLRNIVPKDLHDREKIKTWILTYWPIYRNHKW